LAKDATLRDESLEHVDDGGRAHKTLLADEAKGNVAVFPILLARVLASAIVLPLRQDPVTLTEARTLAEYGAVATCYPVPPVFWSRRTGSELQRLRTLALSVDLGMNTSDMKRPVSLMLEAKQLSNNRAAAGGGQPFARTKLRAADGHAGGSTGEGQGGTGLRTEHLAGLGPPHRSPRRSCQPDLIRLSSLYSRSCLNAS